MLVHPSLKYPALYFHQCCPWFIPWPVSSPNYRYTNQTGWSINSERRSIHGGLVYKRPLHNRHSLIAHCPRRVVASVSILFLGAGKTKVPGREKDESNLKGAVKRHWSPPSQASCQDNVSSHPLILILQETTAQSRVLPAYTGQKLLRFHRVNMRLSGFVDGRLEHFRAEITDEPNTLPPEP